MINSLLVHLTSMHYSFRHSSTHYSFIYSFNKHLLDIHYISSSALYVNICVDSANPEAEP